MNFPMIDITRQLYANINDHYTIYLTYSNFIYFNFLFLLISISILPIKQKEVILMLKFT